MKMFRNPEFRREVIVIAAMTVAFAIGAFFIAWPAGLLVLGLGACVLVYVWLSARRRYTELRKLCDNIDSILHGNETELISASEEGELSILESEIRKMTVRLRESNDALAGDKIKLTNAIADIFHQLRTPITSMNLQVGLLSDEDITYQRRMELIHELKRQLARITWLVETLLKMSKIDAGTALIKSEMVDVKELINKASEPLLIPMELKGVTFTVKAHDEMYIGDIDWSSEALGNIIKNCMEHTPKGGWVSVSVTENALYTEIVVQDTGEGFSEEDLDRLFERFYKGKNSGPDSIGIGLAFARSVIAAQNGTITAANVPTGAEFRIKFYKSVV